MDFLKMRGHQIPCVVDRTPRADGLVIARVSIWDYPWKEEITLSTWGVDWHDVQYLSFFVPPADIVTYENPLTKGGNHA